MLSIMKNRSRERRAGPALSQTFVDMFQTAGAAGSDHGYPNAIRDSPGELEIVALLRPVSVHAGQKDLAGAKTLHALRPIAGVDAGRVSAAVGKNFPVVIDILGVDGDNDALAAERLCRFTDEFGSRHSSRVDRYLVGARLQQLANVFEPIDSATDGQRHEHLFRGARHDVQNDLPVLMRRGDIQKAELVGAFTIVNARDLDRIAGVLELQKFDALDDSAGFDVKAWNNSLGEH